MKYFGFLAIFFLVQYGYAQIKELPIRDFSQKDKEDGMLIDVRTQEEFQDGHLEGAFNIDWFADDFVAKVDAHDNTKDKPVYLYCKKGGRSEKAAAVLDSLGYENVINLIGGYDAYRLNQE